MLAVAVTKRFSRTFTLNARFELPTPGVVALFGRSGAGKTSLVNLIAGLVEADSGHLSLDGAVLLETRLKINLPPERRRMGYVFQDGRLFPHLSVAANLRYGERRGGTPYISFAEVTRLLDLTPLLLRRTHQLSGGERQRVAIARALLSQPCLLLLDEPLASLDRARREEVLPYLETLRDQLSIPMVYVTHDFDEVLRLATHIVLMEAGSVVAQGDIGAMSLDRHLRSIIGPDRLGAIVAGTVLDLDRDTQLTRIRIGGGEIRLKTGALPRGADIRLQLLARDIIVSTQAPRDLSTRNSLAGIVTQVQEDGDSDLITIDIGGTPIMARISAVATRELALRPGMPAWALLNSASLRPH